MKVWLKRIRGVVGTALTWAAAWSGVAVVLSLVGFFGTLGLIRVYVAVAALWAVVGFVGGAFFSVVLGVAERRRTDPRLDDEVGRGHDHRSGHHDFFRVRVDRTCDATPLRI